MLKKTIFVCTLLVATLLCAQPSEASNKRKKKDRTEQEKTDTVRKPRLTPYEKLFRGKRSVTAGDGFMTLHIVGHSPQNSDVEGLQRRQVALLRRVEQLQRPVGVLQKNALDAIRIQQPVCDGLGISA